MNETVNDVSLDDLLGKIVKYKYGNSHEEGELERMGSTYIVNNMFFKETDVKDITNTNDIYTIWL